MVPLVCEPLEPCLAAAERSVVRFAAGGGLLCANECADVLGWVEPEAGDRAQTLRVRWPGGEARLEIPAIPRHRLENAVAAAAVCYAAGLPVERCLPGLLDSGPGAGRGEVIELPGLCVIDDTYNANPAAVRAAIDNLVRVAARSEGRPVAVLGDMRELGPEERVYHRQSGEYAAAAGVRLLWGVGPLSESTAEGFQSALESRHPESGVAGHVSVPAEISPVADSLRAGDVVLFKASRGVRLETMVDGITQQALAGRWVGEADEATDSATAMRSVTRE